MPSSYPAEFIEFLMQPESYPHKPDRVDHIQTHISHVFIASPFVYKFKKPVDFDFLDFSSLDKRKYYCEQEVKLNRRLCKELYLGVSPVYGKGKSWSFNPEGNGEPVEYSVRMKQLSGEHFLKEYARRNQLAYTHLDRLIQKLIPFYKNQPPDDAILKWGRPDRIRVNTDENFIQTEPFIGNTIDRITYDSILMFTDAFLNQRKSLFEKRVQEGHIVDGHGDLHLEHIHITDKRVCIYDCIEFNNRFRYQDIAADIGFLAMDLDFNGLRAHSRYFTEQIAEKLEDPDLLRIVDFYKCYRAYVRAKVNSLESGEEEVDTRERHEAALLASRYFALSLTYSLFGSAPVVLVFMGRIATGKSTLAERVSRELKVKCFSSDIVRKKLAGLRLTERTPAGERDRIYRKSMSEQTYNKLLHYTKKEIAEGKSVLLDATYGKPEFRTDLISSLKSAGTKIFFIETEAPDEIRMKRLNERANQENIISDARIEDLDMLDRLYHSPDEIEPGRIFRIETTHSVDQSVEYLFRTLIEVHLSESENE